MASKRFFLFSARDVQTRHNDTHNDTPHDSDTIADSRSATRGFDSVGDATDGWTTHSGQLAASGYFHADAAWGSVPLEITPMDYAFGRYGPR